MMRNFLKLFLMLGCASLLHSTEVSEPQAQEFMQLLCYSCEGASVFLDNAPLVVFQQVFKDLGSVVESSPVAVLDFLHAALSKLNSGQPLDPFELSRIISWFGRVYSNIDGKLDGGVQALESSLKFVVAYAGCLMVTHVARKCVGHLLEHGILERDSEELCEKIIGERVFDVERKASKKVGEIVKTYKKITSQVEGFLWRALPDYAQNIRTLGIATVDDRLSGPFLAFFLHYCLLDGKIEEMSPWFIRALSGERAFHSTSTTFYPPSAREYFRRLQDDSGVDQQELGDARLYYANEVSELQRALSEGIDRHQRLITKLKARKPSYAEIVGGLSSQIALVKKACELFSHKEFFTETAEKREAVREIITVLEKNQNEMKGLFDQLSLSEQKMGSVKLKHDEATKLQQQLLSVGAYLQEKHEFDAQEQVGTSDGDSPVSWETHSTAPTLQAPAFPKSRVSAASPILESPGLENPHPERPFGRSISASFLDRFSKLRLAHSVPAETASQEKYEPGARVQGEGSEEGSSLSRITCFLPSPIARLDHLYSQEKHELGVRKQGEGSAEGSSLSRTPTVSMASALLAPYRRPLVIPRSFSDRPLRPRSAPYKKASPPVFFEQDSSRSLCSQDCVSRFLGGSSEQSEREVMRQFIEQITSYTAPLSE